jgi:hypothetical protein
VKRSTTILLQTFIVLVGIGALVFLLGEPHLEGRNVNATLFQIYFQDPFLAYAYIASIPFFMTLYQMFKLLEYVRQNKVFSIVAVNALRTIKHCAIAVIGFVAIGEVFILLSESDDRAGGVFMGLLITFISIVMAVVAAKFERRCNEAIK